MERHKTNKNKDKKTFKTVKTQFNQQQKFSCRHDMTARLLTKWRVDRYTKEDAKYPERGAQYRVRVKEEQCELLGSKTRK